MRLLTVLLVLVLLSSCSVSLSDKDRENIENFGNEIRTLNEKLDVVNELNTNLIQLSDGLSQTSNLRGSLTNLGIIIKELITNSRGLFKCD